MPTSDPDVGFLYAWALLRWCVAVAPLVFRALRVLCWAGLLSVPMGGGPPASRPRSELRSARRLEARPGPAASHGQRSLALHTGGIWRAGVWRTGPRHRPPALRPGPAAAHRHGARVSAWTVTVAFNGARANLVCDFRQVLFIAILRRLHFAVFECVSPTGWLFRKGDVMVGDTWRQFPRFYLCMSLVTRGAIYGCE